VTIDENWIEAAISAQERAYVPYSSFSVGACLVTNEDELILAGNIENASYGLSNCAERTAFFKAISEGKYNFKALIISGETEEPISPCGACRQVMVEFCSSDMPVILIGKNRVRKETTVGELLPYAFSKKDLN
jgi:cytidine deaminase